MFAVAAESYVVGNKLGYQGKLIAAVVNSRGGLTVPLKAMYSTGTGDNFAAVIYGKRDGDIPDEAWELLEKYVDSSDQAANRKLARIGVLTVRVSVGQCKTDNKMWKADPEQKLWYTGATKWARRHAPELMVGILSDDDLDRMKAEQRIEQTAEQRRIGFDPGQLGHDNPWRPGRQPGVPAGDGSHLDHGHGAREGSGEGQRAESHPRTGRG